MSHAGSEGRGTVDLGGMPEWPIGAVLKTVVRKHPGFESLSLRSRSDAISGVAIVVPDEAQDALRPRTARARTCGSIETLANGIEFVAEQMAI